ncbi:MAG: Clp protease N-terminal domain-containing protein, partial [Mariprofundaceae bacterium]|nr:Clp protease N-terminal domain-containing protein [Mariprofundaceae bacterium]
MDMNRMTQKVREALAAAQTLAVRLGHQEIDGEHVLTELLVQQDGLAPRLLERMDIQPEAIASRVQDALKKRPRVTGQAAGGAYMSPRLNQFFIRTEDEAKTLNDEYISVEHLLLAFIAEGNNSEAGRIFHDAGITRDRFLKALEAVRGHQRVTSDDPEASYDALKKYGSDLVEMARAGKLDPVIGRDSEIRSVIRILSRKTKNNPVLIGEPGVGKTAIAEGLAQRILNG